MEIPILSQSCTKKTKKPSFATKFIKIPSCCNKKTDFESGILISNKFIVWICKHRGISSFLSWLQSSLFNFSFPKHINHALLNGKKKIRQIQISFHSVPAEVHHFLLWSMGIWRCSKDLGEAAASDGRKLHLKFWVLLLAWIALWKIYCLWDSGLMRRRILRAMNQRRKNLVRNVLLTQGIH